MASDATVTLSMEMFEGMAGALAAEREITVRAHAAARAWLNAFLATGGEGDRALVDRTLCIEWYDAGVQFIACDGSVVFRVWVPIIEEPDEDEPRNRDWPENDEAPETSVVVTDADGFGLGFMRSLLRVTGEEGHQFEPLTLSLHRCDAGATLSLGDEFQTRRLTLRACGQRIDLKLYEGEYVKWRSVQLGVDEAERVDGLAVSPRMMALLGKIKGVSVIDLTFAADGRRVDLVAHGAEAEVRGLFVSMRRQRGADDE